MVLAMLRALLLIATAGILIVPLGACGDGAPPKSAIRVQHVLIAFQHAVGFRDRGGAPERARTRTFDEARKLAASILERAKAGEDFDGLVKEHTDDTAPGIYDLVDGDDRPPKGAYHRLKMAKAFGDVGYSLQPGETGIAEYHQADSPFGWHVIRRLR